MNVELWTIGRTRESWLREGADMYCKRIPHLVPFRYVEWDGPRLPPKPSAQQMLEQEAAFILDKLKPTDQLHLFDEGGKRFTSRAFAAQVEKMQHQGGSKIIFLIGGAYGFGESLYQRAQSKISLSDMTLSHQLVRILALEQLYRAYSILRGLPYHND